MCSATFIRFWLSTHCGLGDSIGGEYFLGNEIFNFSDGDFTDSSTDLALVHSGLKMEKWCIKMCTGDCTIADLKG